MTAVHPSLTNDIPALPTSPTTVGGRSWTSVASWRGGRGNEDEDTILRETSNTQHSLTPGPQWLCQQTDCGCPTLKPTIVPPISSAAFIQLTRCKQTLIVHAIIAETIDKNALTIADLPWMVCLVKATNEPRRRDNLCIVSPLAICRRLFGGRLTTTIASKYDWLDSGAAVAVNVFHLARLSGDSERW